MGNWLIQETTKSFTDLGPGTYWLQVAGVNDLGLKGFDAIYSFTVEDKQVKYCWDIDECKKTFSSMVITAFMLLLAL